MQERIPFVPVIMEFEFATRRVVSSDPDYKELNQLQTMLCYAYNPHLVNHNPEMMDIEPPLIPSLIQELKEAQGDLMEEGNFDDFKAAWSRSEK